MRVLLTNNTLSQRAGSELYLSDVAMALRERGHLPVAFSTVLGGVAAELRTRFRSWTIWIGWWNRPI